MISLTRDTEQLAERLARRDGVSPAEVIRLALEDRAKRIPSKPRRKPSFERMMEISDACSRLPVLDDRSPDEIIGYDDFGVPR